MRVKEDGTFNTTFKTRKGIYELLVIPFSLYDVVVTFIHLKNDVFHPFIDSLAIVYLDYILVYSSTCEYNISHIKHMFETLK